MQPLWDAHVSDPHYLVFVATSVGCPEFVLCNSVMLGAGLLAQKAVAKGLSVMPYIKTSLSPGSGVVTYYLRDSGVIPHLEVQDIFLSIY